MSIFSKAKKKPKPVPTNKVINLSSRGYSQIEIIKILRKEGYGIKQVDAALKVALKSSAVGRAPETPERGARAPIPMPLGIPGKEVKLPPSARKRGRKLDMKEVMKDFEEPEREMKPSERHEPEAEKLPREEELHDLGLPRLPGEKPTERPRFKREIEEEPEHVKEIEWREPVKRELTPLPKFRTSPKRKHEEEETKIEELTERIVEEKWDEIKSKMDNINNSLQDLDDKIKTMEQKLTRVQTEKKTELDEIKEKLGNYQHSIDEVGVRMESVEKALKDSLGPMMESIRALSSAVKSVKKKK